MLREPARDLWGGVSAPGRLRDLSHEVTAAAPSLADVAAAQAAAQPGAPVGPAMARLFATPAGCVTGGYRASLLARVHRRLGVWLWALTGKARPPGRRVSPLSDKWPGSTKRYSWKIE